MLFDLQNIGNNSQVLIFFINVFLLQLLQYNQPWIKSWITRCNVCYCSPYCTPPYIKKIWLVFAYISCINRTSIKSDKKFIYSWTLLWRKLRCHWVEVISRSVPVKFRFDHCILTSDESNSVDSNLRLSWINFIVQSM